MDLFEPHADSKRPSNRANVAFILAIVNSGGLMLLGAYCLKGAVDAQQAHAALAFCAGLFSLLGSAFGWGNHGG